MTSGAAAFDGAHQGAGFLEHGLDEIEPGRSQQDVETRVFQGDIVIGRHAVEPGHQMPIGQQSAAQMKADKASAAGDQEACHSAASRSGTPIPASGRPTLT